MSPRKKSKNILVCFYRNQIFRFLLAASVNSVFGFLVFSFFVFLGARYPIAVFFSTICGVLFNFQTIGKFVFLSNNNMLIFRFALVYIVTYLLFASGVGILVHSHLNTYAAGAIMVIPVGITSFLLNKKLVFNK